MVYNLTECAALFFAYAAMGWFMEVLYMGVRERHLTNRGFLLGPCCPIYGAGMLGITLLFQGSHYGYWHVFFSICAVCWNTQSVPSWNECSTHAGGIITT